MKLFGKTVSKSVKRTLILRLLLIIVAGALLLFLTFYSFGWFVVTDRIFLHPMQVTISTLSYDVLVERTSEYDTGYNFVSGAGNIKDELLAAGYNFSNVSTANSTKIAYEMVNDYVYENKKYLMPGSYGTVTFYIDLKDGVDNCIANFNLSLGAYVRAYDENDNPLMEEVTSVNVLNILKGHILFFTGRTGATYDDYVYTGLVEGSFSYNTAEHSKCQDVGKTDYYKVVLYWEWPITYYDIADNISTTSPTVTKKYPAEVWTYLTENNNYFFAGTPASGSADALSDAYNDGDQTIGVGTSCIVLYINAA